MPAEMPLAHGDMVTAGQLARLTGKSPKTVYMWTKRGVRLLDGTRYVLPVAGIANTGEKLFLLVDAQRVVHAVTRRGTSPAARVAA